ncbi:winged helix-turn-helix transcriptional regulator [Salidesulfovibrio brasiliensis]|uniref:winged helix-turn-helix transcriptional regulator n=1 Tax=Salidesulfovibrio brasiliensis TaxID=221711 RepID=UPI0006D147A6|nr:helix-turn-helix domain-containing protein [Salidesulfovibrio brasiliensis]
MSECGLKHLDGREYYCAMELTLQIIGGKWKPLIIHHLGQQGTLRFNELRRTMPTITQKMLTQQLRELETDGIVHREVYPQVPPKVEYSLTALGRTVTPVISRLCEWGSMYEAERLAEKQNEAAQHSADKKSAA